VLEEDDTVVVIDAVLALVDELGGVTLGSDVRLLLDTEGRVDGPTVVVVGLESVELVLP